MNRIQGFMMMLERKMMDFCGIGFMFFLVFEFVVLEDIAAFFC